MKIRIHCFCALALISVLGLFAFAAAQADLQGQSFDQFSRSPQLRAKTGKARKANAAGKPAHYTYEVLYNFCSEANCADGNQPEGALARDAAGNLYGTTFAGGAANHGEVFELDTAGDETVLYSFCSKSGCADGSYPDAALILDSAGNLYGTAGGGANASSYYTAGVVFELAPPTQTGGAWTETVLHDFCSLANCADGMWPTGTLALDAAGNVYGMTEIGGYGDATMAGSYGTVFELSPPSQPGSTWTETVLHAFCSASGVCEDGVGPSGGLVQDAAGNLYGTTLWGPVANGSTYIGATPGTVFQVSPPPLPGGAWVETVLHYFCSGYVPPNCADGKAVIGGLVMDTAGNLYGTTASGGASDWGTVFEVSPPSQPEGDWTETVPYSFCSLANCADGANPWTSVTQDPAGNLYGNTDIGGADGGGTTFELSPPAQAGGSWSEAVLHNYCGVLNLNCADGGQSSAGLLRDPVGNLYSTTPAGGSHGAGTLFTLAVPSFVMAGTSVSLDPGATTGNTSTITLYPRGGFTGSVKLTAAITSKPSGAQELPTLSFGTSNAVSITEASAVTATLTITTTAPTSAALEHSARPGAPW